MLKANQRVSGFVHRDKAAVVHQRTDVVARFLHGLLQRQHFHKEAVSADTHAEMLATARYEAMLQRAEQCTFQPPTRQFSDSTEPGVALEDGEKLLDWCIQERPCDLQARILQLRNLLIQGLGREQEVPGLAIKALQESRVSGCEFMSGGYFQVQQIVLLGLKVLHKLSIDKQSTPKNPCTNTYTIKSFLTAAQQAVPGMAYDLQLLTGRLHRQLCSYSPKDRRKLLHDKSYMSCVDLQFVSGEHHAATTAAAAAGGDGYQAGAAGAAFARQN